MTDFCINSTDSLYWLNRARCCWMTDYPGCKTGQLLTFAAEYLSLPVNMSPLAHMLISLIVSCKLLSFKKPEFVDHTNRQSDDEEEEDEIFSSNNHQQEIYSKMTWKEESCYVTTYESIRNHTRLTNIDQFSLIWISINFLFSIYNSWLITETSMMHKLIKSINIFVFLVMFLVKVFFGDSKFPSYGDKLKILLFQSIIVTIVTVLSLIFYDRIMFGLPLHFLNIISWIYQGFLIMERKCKDFYGDKVFIYLLCIEMSLRLVAAIKFKLLLYLTTICYINLGIFIVILVQFHFFKRQSINKKIHQICSSIHVLSLKSSDKQNEVMELEERMENKETEDEEKEGEKRNGESFVIKTKSVNIDEKIQLSCRVKNRLENHKTINSITIFLLLIFFIGISSFYVFATYWSNVIIVTFIPLPFLLFFRYSKINYPIIFHFEVLALCEGFVFSFVPVMMMHLLVWNISFWIIGVRYLCNAEDVCLCDVDDECSPKCCCDCDCSSKQLVGVCEPRVGCYKKKKVDDVNCLPRTLFFKFKNKSNVMESMDEMLCFDHTKPVYHPPVRQWEEDDIYGIDFLTDNMLDKYHNYFDTLTEYRTKTFEFDSLKKPPLIDYIPSSSYQVGQPVYIINENNLLGYFAAPSNGGQCNFNSFVKYDTDEWIECQFKPKSVEKFCSTDLINYQKWNIQFLRTPRILGIASNVTERRNFVNFEELDKIKDDPFHLSEKHKSYFIKLECENCKSPQMQGDCCTNVPHNLTLRFDITNHRKHKSTMQISSARLRVHDYIEVCPSTDQYVHRWHIKWHKTNLGTKKTKGSQGGRAYEFREKIPIAKESDDSPYTANRMQYLSIPKANIDCDEKRTNVQFGLNILSGCFIHAKKSGGSICTSVQKEIYKTIMDPIGEMLVASYPDARDKDNVNKYANWLPVFRNPPIENSPKKGKRTNICRRMVTSLVIQIYTSHFGLWLNRGQKIVGVTFSWGKEHSIYLPEDGNISVVVSVMFLEINKKYLDRLNEKYYTSISTATKCQYFSLGQLILQLFFLFLCQFI
ncbi:hypothetical protein SNEBB_010981 [Seison nebaliae]|nr:hypothetical protein SNEBB_010981 [Seison nebaliae]